jgi:hypothetical protein
MAWLCWIPRVDRHADVFTWPTQALPLIKQLDTDWDKSMATIFGNASRIFCITTFCFTSIIFLNSVFLWKAEWDHDLSIALSGANGVVRVPVLWPSKHEAMSSNPSTAKKQKEKKRKKWNSSFWLKDPFYHMGSVCVTIWMIKMAPWE